MAAKSNDAIQKRISPLPSKMPRHLTVGALADALLNDFPAADAEEWDMTGLYVGERAVPLAKVACALDPTVSAIAHAASCGANVLVTHHPAYLDTPRTFAPEPSSALSPGAAVFAAIRNGISLMCFHTALDVSQRAQKVLPSLLGLDFKGKLACPLPASKKKGYGQICAVPSSDGEVCTLGELAARSTAVFGRAPRVWGAMASPVSSVVTATGSASNVGQAALELNADCLVCGEVKYHDALALSQAGLSIIELGHDVSELPLVAVLADAVVRAGVPRDAVVIVEQADAWTYPEAIRL